MSHTPTPWQTLIPNGVTIIRDRPDDTDIIASEIKGNTDKEATANAAFIVRACNSHDALVEALTYLLNETEDYIKINHLHALHNHSLERARTALALAQKEHP